MQFGQKTKNEEDNKMKKKILILMVILSILTLAPVFAIGHQNDCTNTSYLVDCCTKTFNIVAETGYKIKSLIVNGVSQTISEEQKNEMTYTLGNVNEPQIVEIDAEPKLYTITVIQGANGQLVPSNNTIVNNQITVKYGQTQTFEITPNTGYMLSTLKVDGQKVNGAIGNAYTTYTFNDVDSDHTIEATFETTANEEMIFVKTDAIIYGAKYIICCDTNALTHNSSNTLGYSQVTIENDTIRTNDTSLMWSCSSISSTSSSVYSNTESFSYTGTGDTTYSLVLSVDDVSIESGTIISTYDRENLWLINYNKKYYLTFDGTTWSTTTDSSLAAKVSLYANLPSSGDYIINYYPNGGTGSMPQQVITKDGNGYTYNDLLFNKFAKKACKFAGWATSPHGSVTYTDGQRIRVTKDLDLFAVWADDLTLKFDANGGNGTMNTLEVSKGVAITLPSNQFTHDTLTFAGWSTTPTGEISYYNNARYTPKTSTTLYAVWRPTYQVTFNANGGTGIMATQTFILGIPQNLTNNTFTYYGKTFIGWSTTRNGAVEYGNGVSFSTTQDITLYAQWTTTTYTLTYNARGGSGAPAQQTWLHGGSVTIASAQPTCNGCTFQGWYTGTGGSGSKVSPGTSYNWTSNMTVYAYWKCTGTYYSNCSGISTKTSDCSCWNGTCNISNGHEEVTSYGAACSCCGHNNLRVVEGTCSNASCTFGYTLYECMTSGCSVYELDGKQVHTGICAYCKGERKIITGYYCDLHRIELTTKTEWHCLHGQTSSHNY